MTPIGKKHCEITILTKREEVMIYVTQVHITKGEQAQNVRCKEDYNSGDWNNNTIINDSNDINDNNDKNNK